MVDKLDDLEQRNLFMHDSMTSSPIKSEHVGLRKWDKFGLSTEKSFMFLDVKNSSSV